MRNSAPFLGTTEDRNQAFAGIKSFKVKILQDPYGYYCRKQHQRETVYSKSSLPRYTTCCNPRCQQGQIDLQSLILFSGTGEYEFYCNGHEGSPKGRRKGDPCDNVFKITISVERLA